jgi:hypothetical protein
MNNYELLHLIINSEFDISAMSQEERIIAATELCFKADELLKEIARFEWDISEIDSSK